MENIFYGLVISLIGTLVVRFVAKGEALYASVAAFATTAISTLALVHIVTAGTGVIEYAMGVGVGTYTAIMLEMKRGRTSARP